MDRRAVMGSSSHNNNDLLDMDRDHMAVLLLVAMVVMGAIGEHQVVVIEVA